MNKIFSIAENAKTFLRLGCLTAATVLFAACAKQFPDTGNDITVKIDSIVPAQGAAGTPVLIYGSGFSAVSSGNSVYFNGKPAFSDTSSFHVLRAFAPAGGSTGNVSVAANRDSIKGPVFTYVPAPVITNVVYNGVFIVSGQHFDPQVSVVSVSGQTIPGFTYAAQGSQQSLSLSSLALSTNWDNPAPVVVTVKNISSNPYPYLFYPQITSFTPDTAHYNKPYAIHGLLFGNRTVHSTLRAFIYNANQQKVYMSPDPAILSWTTNTIQLTIPNYNSYVPPLTYIPVYMFIYLEVSVDTKSTSQGTWYSLRP